MKKTAAILLVIVLSTLLVGSCESHRWEDLHPTPIPTPCALADTVSYANDIVPIINGSCGAAGAQAPNCHGATGPGGNYSDYNHFSNVTCADSTCDLYHDIQWDSQALHNMPLSGSKLSPCDLSKLIRWMDQGSLNN